MDSVMMLSIWIEDYYEILMTTITTTTTTKGNQSSKYQLNYFLDFQISVLSFMEMHY